MKRKIAVLMTAFVFVISLSACGDNMSTSDNDSDKVRIKELERELEELKADQRESLTVQEETVPFESVNSDFELYDVIGKELDQYIADQDFEKLFSEYSIYREMYPELSEKLEEKKTQYIEQITSIFDERIADADELAVVGDNKNARQILDDIAVITKMKYHFEELDIYNDIYNERLSYYTYYNGYMEPVNLMCKEFDIGDGGYYRDKNWSQFNKFEDRYGGSYEEYYEFIVPQANMRNQRPYVVFDANENYEMFNACLTCHKGMTEDKIFHVEVYGDDTLLYTSDSFSSYEEPFTINVDITGCKLIEFVAVREDYNLSYATKQPSVAVYEVSFSHTKLPEFEYYIPQKPNENHMLSTDDSVSEAALTYNTDEFCENGAIVIEQEVSGEEFTNASGVSALAGVESWKEQTRAQNKEALLEIIQNDNLTEEEKKEAVNSMIILIEIAQKESDAQMLLAEKGFTQTVVSISGDTADVMVEAADLTESQTAQILDIVQRTTNIAPENIIITISGVY